MSELSFEQMLEDSVKTIRNGEIVQGKVIDVKEDEIILNIGYKADGIISKDEYSYDENANPLDEFKQGESKVEKTTETKKVTPVPKPIVVEEVPEITGSVVFYVFYPTTIPNFHGFFNFHRFSSFIKKS